MAGRLDGKVIVILGASDERSMGAATAKRCAAEGAQLVLAARRLDKVQEVADSIGAKAVACDISDEQQVSALAEAAISAYGRLDGAISFAGVDAAAPIADITPEQLKQCSDIHFVGSALFIKHMTARMKEGGSVVLTSSQTAIMAGPGLAAYAGSKAGADHVVRIAAVEYGPANIRVNSLLPGFTPTAMTSGYLQVPTIEPAFIKEAPLKRLPTADDVANAALWLLSEECFMTGRAVDLSGGLSLGRLPTAAEMGF